MTTKKTNRTLNLIQNVIATLLWVLTFLILISASNYLLLEAVYINTYSEIDIFLANLFLLILSGATLNLVKKTRFKSLLTLPLIILFLVICFALTEVIIYKFSGVGFNEQTFLHLEPESLIIAFKMDPLIYSTVILGVLLLSAFLAFLPSPRTRKIHSVILILISTAVLSVTGLGTALGRFTTGYYQFNTDIHIAGISAEEIEPYRKLGIRPVYNDVTSLKAEFQDKPKNLIVIYLESFSHFFSDSTQYPNLTPNINRLKNTYGELENYVSTASITIQGIVSSQCGLVPKMISGNNISDDQIQYQKLPCLPNILDRLDYRQEFMGGAKKHFANKALILKSMGFDQVWGWYDYDMPKNYQTNSFGLQDGDLFDRALNRIKTLDALDKPFHLSLLTLSTHLNGNPDPTCPKYSGSVKENKFLDAIYCTDYLLGQFLNQLKTQGILDNTTVFITGDHGVFKVDLIKDLFGKDINTHKLLGVLINGLDFDKTLPLGLYDTAPMLIDSLNINTNTNFINGLTPKEITRERFLLGAHNLTNLQEGCNQSNPIKPPIDKCEHQRLLDISWAHSTIFTPKIVWQKIYDPKVMIKSTQKKHHARLIINGEDQTPMFLVNGYPIDTKKRQYNHHIFLLVYDKKTKRILDRSAYKYIGMYDYQADYMRDLLIKYKKNKDVILFIFTEGGQNQSAIAKWNEVFNEIDSQKFNFPQKPYIGIIQYADNGMQLLEWSSKEGESIERAFKNINLIDSKNAD